MNYCNAPARYNTSFLMQTKYVILFYIILDTVTTWAALVSGLAFEMNPLLANAMFLSGFAGLIVAKILFLILMYIVYRYYPQVIPSSAYVISWIGVALVANNLLVLAGFPGLFQLMGGVF